jgi:hypothetical protein
MEFNLAVDKKVTVWNRSHYVVQADSLEQAVEKMKDEFEAEEYPEEGDVVFVENEVLYDTEDGVSVDDNDGQSTKEIVNGAAAWSVLLTNEPLRENLPTKE